MTQKSDLHDVWEHDGDQMRKFEINDQVVPTGDPITQESASWGPRKFNDAKQEMFDACEAFTVSNAVPQKIFGQTYWFHEIGGWARNDDGLWYHVGYFGPFNAADLRAPTDVEEQDL